MIANQAIKLDQLRHSIGQACTLLKALAHDDRLILLCQLAEGECCVSELEDQLGLHQPTLSQQLGVLRQEGLVETRRNGNRIYYRIASANAMAVMKALQECFCK